MSLRARSLRDEVLCQRPELVGRVSKRRAEISDAGGQGSLFESLCEASPPFITIGYLRRLVAAGDNGSDIPCREAIPEEEFQFPAASSTAIAMFAVLPPSGKRDHETVVDPLSRGRMQRCEAREIVAVLDTHMDDDLVFWHPLCGSANSSEAPLVTQIFALFRVHGIISTKAPAMVRLIPSHASMI